MAKKAKKIKTKKGLKLSIVNPNAAGIDISSTEMQVCVPEDRDGDNNRRFGSFTCNLHEISGWLKACQIETVAMEATGVYRVPLYERLIADGFDVLPGNAKAIRNIGEKKTDEADAGWIMLLHSYGLIKAGFQPCNEAREIRNPVRHRDNLLRSSSKEVQHMQKSMELMNIKLTHVISDILGKSGQDIIAAILAGQRDPQALAALADPRCKTPREEIEKSLEANWDGNLLFTLKQSFDLYHFIQKQMKACEEKIEKLILVYQASLPEWTVHKTPCKRSNKPKSSKNSLSIDIEQYAHELWGVNLMGIKGVSEGTLLGLAGELGHDFVTRFDSYKEFCCWANITPNNKISGGKILSGKVPKRKNPAGQILRAAANSVKCSQSPLGFYFRRIQAKSGYIPAIIATANKLGRIIYTMVKYQVEYDEEKGKEKQVEILKKKLVRKQIELMKLEKMLKDCA